MPERLHLLTPVWGGHVRLYCDVVIPALLAPGNLPALDGCKYIILTMWDDMDTIKASPAFARLSEVANVVFGEIFDLANNHATSTFAYKIGIKAAKGAPVVLLCPDLVLADGALAALKRLGQTHDVIYTTGIRTKKAEMAAALERFHRGPAIEIGPRDLMRLALDNLHPLAYNSFWSGREGGPDFIPANLYWRAGTEGLVARCYHLHPLLVRPQVQTTTFKGTIDIGYVDAACPDTSKDYVVTDSDELLMIELSPPSHYFTTNARKGSIEDTAKWTVKHANARHHMLFKKEIRMHSGLENEAAWKAASEWAHAVATQLKYEIKRMR